MDNVFSLNAKLGGIWSDDAAFSRGVLYCLLTQLIPNSLTHETALVVWKDFLQLGSKIHIEESTQVAMGDAFVNKLTLITTPNFSFEQNAQVIFHAYTVLSLVEMEEYQRAIKEGELIMHMYPTSRYAQDVGPNQIRAIKDAQQRNK
jgi:hypothetical protein